MNNLYGEIEMVGILTESGEARIMDAMEAIERGEVKEFENADDLILDPNLAETGEYGPCYEPSTT